MFSRSAHQALAVPLVAAVVCACTDTTNVEGAASLTAAVEAPGVSADGLTCDATDEAFARQLVTSLWGRRALSVHELAALVRIAEVEGRGALVDAMLRSPEMTDAWAWWLNDWLYLNRAGERGNTGCFAAPSLADATDDLAAWVRDHGPVGSPYPGGEFKLIDLLRSSLLLDDLSPVIRVQPFLQVGSWVIQADNPEHELATRRLYARIFESQVLNRRLECLTCHNSAWSVTDALDPEDDKSWPASGRVEAAVFGDDTGLDPNLIAALFRIRDVMSLELRENTQDLWHRADGLRPWGMHAACGQFEPPEALPEDWLESESFLVNDFGDRGSIYDLEGLLRAAFEQARGEPLDFSPDSMPDGLTALVQMIALSVAERVWEEVTGKPLTAPHNLPRNRTQRDVLQHLASTFVSSGYSLKALLRATVLHPFYAQSAPSQCATGVDSYYLPPLFDPWSVESSDPDVRGNSVGDLVSRLPARVLLRSVTTALEWPDMPTFFPQNESVEQVKLPPLAAMQRDIGAFMTDGEIGFRGSTFQETLAWESAFGGCLPPEGLGNAQTDYIDRLVQAESEALLRGAVLSLKDRLLAEPRIESDEEERVLAALAGASLDSPMNELEDPDVSLRRVCTALISTPQFVLSGLAPADYVGTDVAFTIQGADAQTHCLRVSALVPASVCVDGQLEFDR